MLWEVARYLFSFATVSDDQFKLNDHLTPHYARELMAREPELAGVFELRERSR